MVLKKILPIHKDVRGKWTLNWEGSYVVKQALSGGALILSEMDGNVLPKPVNSYFTKTLKRHLKKKNKKNKKKQKANKKQTKKKQKKEKNNKKKRKRGKQKGV